MSKNKKLTKAVRERMSQTGESYTVARVHILAALEAGDTCPACKGLGLVWGVSCGRCQGRGRV